MQLRLLITMYGSPLNNYFGILHIEHSETQLIHNAKTLRTLNVTMTTQTSMRVELQDYLNIIREIRKFGVHKHLEKYQTWSIKAGDS